MKRSTNRLDRSTGEETSGKRGSKTGHMHHTKGKSKLKRPVIPSKMINLDNGAIPLCSWCLAGASLAVRIRPNGGVSVKAWETLLAEISCRVMLAVLQKDSESFDQKRNQRMKVNQSLIHSTNKHVNQ